MTPPKKWGPHHGRTDARECLSSSGADYLHHTGTLAEWVGPQSIVMVRSEHQSRDQTTVIQRYPVSRLQSEIKLLLHSVRAHCARLFRLPVAWRRALWLDHSVSTPADPTVIIQQALRISSSLAFSDRGTASPASKMSSFNERLPAPSRHSSAMSCTLILASRAFWITRAKSC